MEESVVFIAAVYNEEAEVFDLVHHVWDFVDQICIVDDDSTDNTLDILHEIKMGRGYYNSDIDYKSITHTGLPETVKNEALRMAPDHSWVLMLDADERFITPLPTIIDWLASSASEEIDYVYFQQYEIIDGQHVRTFQKCKLFRKEHIRFSTGIHEDDAFTGKGAYFGWEVAHRKSVNKQIQRETEYLATYQKLLTEGKIDQGRYEWLVNLHHYVKPHG